jgi:hypothetical protein
LLKKKKMSLPEFLNNLKHSTIFHIFFTSAIAFIVAFTLDLFFSNLFFWINCYCKKEKSVPPPPTNNNTIRLPNKRSTRGYGRGRRRK